jgi:hypothetical protein
LKREVVVVFVLLGVLIKEEKERNWRAFCGLGFRF